MDTSSTTTPPNGPDSPPEACGRVFEQLIDGARTGEIDDQASSRLLDHLDRCADCSQLFDLLGTLAAEDEAPEPSAAQYEAMRAAVRRARRRDERAASRPVGALAARLARLRLDLGPLALAASAVFLLLLGALLGRASLRPQQADRWPLAAGEVDTGQRFDDIRLERLGDGDRVRLRFDAVSPVDVVLPATDPLVARLAIEALAGAARAGDRMRAADFAGANREPRSRQVLIDAMHHDPNLGVRLAAQRGILAGGARAEAEAAMLSLLGESRPLPLQLVALDYLLQHGVEDARIREALRAGLERPETPNAAAGLLLARSRTAAPRGGAAATSSSAATTATTEPGYRPERGEP